MNDLDSLSILVTVILVIQLQNLPSAEENLCFFNQNISQYAISGF